MKKRLLSLLFLPIMVLGISIVNANDVSCESSFEYDEDNNICYKLDNTYNVPIYYGIDMDPSHSYNGKPIGTITIKLSGENTLTMMDMNLGATASGVATYLDLIDDVMSIGEDAASYGNVYQWGNNTPFSNSGSEVNTGNHPELFTGTRAIYENYWPGHPFNSELFRIADRNYWSGAMVGDNMQQNFDNLWGGLNDVNEDGGGIYNGSIRQGPCPTGYHVPSVREWDTLFVSYFTGEDYGNRIDTVYTNFHRVSAGLAGADSFMKAFKLPFAPARGGNGVATWGDHNSAYWTSSPADYEGVSYLFSLSFSDVAINMWRKSVARPIRCFKDSHLAPSAHTLTFYENSGDLLGATGEDGEGTLIQNVASGKMAQQPVNPTKVNATFLRWIKEGDEEAAFDFSNPITSSKNLKAIYECDDGYLDVDGECTKIFEITINVNNSDFGSVDSGLVVATSGTAISIASNVLTIGDINVTATPSESGAQYLYSFVDWSNECGETLTSDCTITGNFSQTINEYEITWKDGDSILKTDNVEYGNVPNYGENPTKSGNVFDAWEPNPSEVTGNAIYTATWKLDINNNGIADEDEDHFTLTIHYVNSKGGEVFPDYTGSYVSGASYSVASSPKTHYTVSSEIISGVMSNDNVIETVTYSTETEDTNDNGIADEDEDHSTLTIHYVNSKGGEVFPDYTGSYVSGASYSVISNEKEHYTIDKATISGVMGNLDVEERVVYTANNDKNNNGVADEDEPKSGGSSGGGSRGRTNTKTQDSQQSGTDFDKSTGGQESISSIDSTFTKEQEDAYEFAKGKRITTMPTINDADMEGKLTRIAMAKMLSYYAINVLGQKPDETRINKFKDITDKMDAEYNNAVTLAYQLGIMGINMPDNKFRPDDEVIRAEFGTALSRMLFGIADGEGERYYSTHLAKLMEEHIITVDTPNLKELRGYVMIMLMRSAK